jgi:hypothetical protein
MKKILFLLLLTIGFQSLQAQKMSMEEYKLVTEFRIENLDEDTYIKINQAYVLDRYKMKPAYFIAGEKETKNRVDLYTVIRRQDLTKLGLLMVYTDMTTKKLSYICLPFQADNEVWVRYYDDLKYGGREQPAMAFAIGSVLSKELSNIMVAGASGNDYEVENSDYDICFPAGSAISMLNGLTAPIEKIAIGDTVLAMDTFGQLLATVVTAIEIHETRAPLVKIITMPAQMQTAATAAASTGYLPHLHLLATPNHPLLTADGKMKIGDLYPSQELMGVFDGEIQQFKVKYVSMVGAAQKVYNLKTIAGNYVVNNVLVSDK